MTGFPPFLRRGCVSLVAVLVPFGAAPSMAQQAGQEDGYRIIETAPAPAGTSSAPYAEIAAKEGLQADTIYATRIDGQLVSGQQLPSEDPDIPTPREPLLDMNGGGVALAVLLILAGLAAWMKFGAGGALLARAPTDTSPGKEPTPDGWELSTQDADADPSDLFSRLARMSDRGNALVLLLHHCLIAAGSATQVRFARSDTERRAFARLPRDYVHGSRLSGILKTAELAHYGGRPVDDTEFSTALEAGRQILAASPEGTAHG